MNFLLIHLLDEFTSSNLPFVALTFWLYDFLWTQWTTALANVISHVKMIPTRACCVSWLCNAANLYHSVKCLPVWGFLRMHIILFFLFLFCTHPQWHYPPWLPSPLYVSWKQQTWQRAVYNFRRVFGVVFRKREWEWDKKIMTERKKLTRYETSVWQNGRLLESTCWIWTCFFTLSSP